MRIVVLAMVVVMGLAGSADAEFTSGEGIFHIRKVPGDAVVELGGHENLGYFHSYWGLFDLDLSRSDGQFVVYTGDTYVAISDADLARLGGASVPWKYRIPVGWIVILALVEFGIMTSTRRRVGVIFAIAGAMLVIALVFYLIGLDPEWVIPLALAGHHVVVSLVALRWQKRIDAADDPRGRELLADDPNDAPAPDRAPLPSPPRVETDPFRAPPAPKPIVTERPPERPSTAPIVHDPNAEQPKLLR